MHSQTAFITVYYLYISVDEKKKIVEIMCMHNGGVKLKKNHNMICNKSSKYFHNLFLS